MGWWRWPRDSRGAFWVFPVSGWPWPGPEPRSGVRLIEESAAFLRGHLAEAVSAGGAIPAWVWTNLLAHGSEEELRAERSKEHSDLWEAARGYLAADVLDLAATCGSLAAVQREVLVPFELDLAARLEVTEWGPREWVVAVADVLNRYRQVQQRSAARRHPLEP